jgi:hypothetical protein
MADEIDLYGIFTRLRQTLKSNQITNKHRGFEHRALGDQG